MSSTASTAPKPLRVDAAHRADADGVAATKRAHVHELAQQIAQLAKPDCSADDFCRGFLARLVEALAAREAILWQASGVIESRNRDRQSGENSKPLVVCAVGAEGAKPTISPSPRIADLVTEVFADGRPRLIPAGEGRGASDSLLLMAPIAVTGDVRRVVVVAQWPVESAAAQRGYLRFLAQLCRVAADYFTAQRLRQLSERQDSRGEIEGFIATIHRRLDLNMAAMAVVNEARRLARCDRVSLAVCRGRRCAMQATSGVDSVDRRAQQVTRLAALAEAVVATGQPLWFTGSASELAPQIEHALHELLDLVPSRVVAVLPLNAPGDDEASTDADHRARTGQRPWRPIGALIFEQTSGDDARLRTWAPRLAQHSAAALANALDHHSIFLLPVWRRLAKVRERLSGSIPKLLIAIAAVFVVAIALFAIPVDFTVKATGQLRPVERREVFAEVDGVLVEVDVEHGQQVSDGQVLARLRSTDLEYEIAGLIGKKTTAGERMSAIQRAMLDSRQLSPEEQNRLAGELAELREAVAGLDRQITLYRRKEDQLTVRSPRDGQIATWQVRDTMLHRPVVTGQALMTVVDPDGPWEIELYVPERRMGHVLRAARSAETELHVQFALASHPGQRLTGRITEVDTQAEVREGEGSTVLVRVAIDRDSLPDLRDGAQVTARVDCGRRSLAFVLFHDLVETVQSKVLFWF
jgi:multidrug efflux pump subunit AcrA (membrane-fusion protein)